MAKILVVDDSPTQALRYQFLLENAGFDVELAKNGQEAWEKLEHIQPSLILTDLQMPVMDGLQLVKRVHTDYPKVPIVLMTAHGSETIGMEALQAGAASYVPKEILEREIISTLRGLLEVREAQREREWVLGFLQETRASFVLETNPAIVTPLIACLEEDMKRIGIKDETVKMRVITSLRESLENAVYHGNLEVNSQLRESDQPSYYRTAEQRRVQDPYRTRKIYVHSEMNSDQVKFTVRDEGPGFDPKKIPDPTHPDNLIKASGRGLLLINTFMDSVSFNDRGNEITMVKNV